MMTSITDNKKSRGRPRTGVGTLIGVRMPPDELALLDRFIAEQQLDMSRPEALRHAFRDWAMGQGLLPDGQHSEGAATEMSEQQMTANADEVRTNAADAADAAMVGISATEEQKGARRRELTDEPAVVQRARGKGTPDRAGKPKATN